MPRTIERRLQEPGVAQAVLPAMFRKLFGMDLSNYSRQQPDWLIHGLLLGQFGEGLAVVTHYASGDF